LSATLSAQAPDFTPLWPLIGALMHKDTAEAKKDAEKRLPCCRRAVRSSVAGQDARRAITRRCRKVAVDVARARDIGVDEAAAR